MARLEIPTAIVIPWWSPIETTFLHDQMIDALVRTDTLDVVERTRLDKLLTEQALTKDGVTDPNQAAKLGKMVGASHFVLGSLANLELQKTANPLPYTDRTESSIHGRIKIDFRVVDVETSRVIASDTEETTDELRTVDSPGDGDAKQLWERLRRQAAANIAQRIVNALVPVKVVSVGSGAVELSRGVSTGIGRGNVFDVLALGEALKDPDTGRVVEQRQQKVGQVEVTSVDPGKATARITTQSGEIKVGATCRLLPAPPPPPVAGRQDPLQERW